MNITFYNKDNTKTYSIGACENGGLYLINEEHEGGQFDADDISDVIFNALDKFFKENY